MWRKCGVFLVCIVALMIAPVATWAQDTACVKGLAAADCELLDAATANVDQLTAFDLGYDLNFAFTGAPIGDIHLEIKGHGPVDLTKVTNSDMRTVLDNLEMSSALDVIGSGQGNKATTKAEVRITDGVLYLFGDMNTTAKSSWYKVTLSKVVESATDNPDLAALNVILLPQALMSQAMLNGNATGTRTGGPSLDGKATRLYSLNYEGGVLLDTLPKVQQQFLFNQFITGLAANLPPDQRAKLNNNAAFKRAIERVARGAKIVIGWLVEPSGKMIRGFEIEIHLKVDAALGKLIAPEFAAGVTNFDVTLLVTYSKLGKSIKVEAPEDAVDLTDLIQIPKTSA